jgi:two-component system heavy metal sensor histidine kinase CusS
MRAGMIEQPSFRMRLLLWYTAVMAASLLIFAGVVWIGLRQNLIAAREDALREHLQALQKYVTDDGKFSPRPNKIREEAKEFSQTLPADCQFRILDSSGSSLYSSGEFAANVLSARVTERTIELDIRGRVYRIQMSLSLKPVSETLRRLDVILAFSIPIALFVASLGGYWMTRRALAPVRAMAEAARSFDSADLRRRVPVPVPKDEFRQLAEMWNGMLERIEEGVERMRRFTADASHDLRTPIAAIRTTAEVTLRRPRSVEEHERALERILGQSGRATALIEDLLTLARSEGDQVNPALELIEFRSFLDDTCENLLPLAQAKGLVLNVALPPQEVWLPANAGALRRLTEILVDNALKNTDAGQVNIRLGERDDAVSLVVEDTGRGISPSDLPHIFERFYRGDKSRSDATGGSGLGLAIAKSIAESHGGEIRVESDPGRNTKFEVQFPRTGMAAMHEAAKPKSEGVSNHVAS